jgi:DNA-binding NarL/FixJ family response regulator
MPSAADKLLVIAKVARQVSPGDEVATNCPLIRVLLVEDRPGDAAEIRQMLGRSDQFAFSVHHVEDMESALDELRERRFEVALVDPHVAGSRGPQSLQQLCAEAPDMPLIVTTEVHSETEAIEAMRAQERRSTSPRGCSPDWETWKQPSAR